MDNMTDKDTKRKRGKPFQPGTSGNPSGRPAGARNATTLAMEALLDGEAETISRKAIEMALLGDQTMIRLCMDRLLPPRKDRPVSFALPKVENPAEARSAMSSVLRAVAIGDITPGEASEIAKLIDSYVRANDSAEVADRLEKLEKRAEAKDA